jgi:membrane protein DedA with SNARE-associated domain
VIESFIAWLAQLPPGAVYLIIGGSTLVENLFPPTPSDVAVALGAFLTHGTAISVQTVFLVAWLSNLAGAIALYAVGRRYGRRFFASRLGRRLVAPEAIVAMEREYLRFGIAGIFFARLIPGFRSFVAPFAGFMNLSPLTAIAPLTVASALWYAVLSWVGARLGQEWDAISRFLAGLNRTLAVIGAILLVAVIVYLARRRRPRPRYERLLRLIHRALGEELAPEPLPPGDPATASAAAFMYELTRADLLLTPEERQVIEDHFRQTWGVGPGTEEGRPSDAQSAIPLEETRELATEVASRFDHARRLALLERLWHIAAAHGTLSRHEARLVQRAADLLGLSHEEVARAEARVRNSSREGA